MNDASFCITAFLQPPAISTIRYTQRKNIAMYAAGSPKAKNRNILLCAKPAASWLNGWLARCLRQM
jgi:hypothetical protein